MPRQTEHSDDPRTLPTPELNPLINPVLGQNMGRWAEVYFTSPPEKREQAVLELLRELEAKTPTPENRFGAAPRWVPQSASLSAFVPDSQTGEAQPARVPCHTCGREIPATQKYCGMCGARQGREESGAELHTGDRQVEDSPRAPWENGEPLYDSRQHDFYEPRSGTDELSLFQAGHGGSYSDDDQIFSSYTTPSGSYRVYVGIALAMVMVALGYMAWRSAQATSQTAHVESQAPPVVATQPTATGSDVTTPSPSNAATPDRTPPADAQPAVPPSNAAHAAGSKAGVKPVDKPLNTAPPPTTPNVDENAQTEGMTGYGAEELGIAQRYLNGGNGQQTNKAEAAKWLWKAIAKHNATATLLLADLYLKGDGVSKNCDQARLLLDSAARGGMKEAGDRLRHLQAFGCQ